MNWFDRILPGFIQTSKRKSSAPDGLWTKCDKCEELVYTAELKRNLNVCGKCDNHMYIKPRQRLENLLDDASIKEIGVNLETIDILKFKDSKSYKDRLAIAKRTTQENEAIIVMSGTLNGQSVVVAAMDFKFMGGSMGSVVGEKFVLGAKAAVNSNSPYIVFSASGGARMQEALFSLMQMAKTSASLTKLRAAKCPFISVLTNPTMGGVSASFAMLGDINIAEPEALIGFAGQRVIEQTVRETLPEGFQRAEYLLEHGAIDKIVSRKDMNNFLSQVCSILMKRNH